MFTGNKVLSLAATLGVTAMVLISTSDVAGAFTESTLYSFCSTKNCADGAEPLGEVAMDQSGTLYGTTLNGGQFGNGVVFQFVPATGQYNVIHNFCSLDNCADGKNPRDVKMVIDIDGNLYGTTSEGGDNLTGPGVVFELEHRKSGWVEKILHTFCPHLSKNCIDAGAPNSGLTYAGAASGQPYDGTSPLFGTTPFGGTNGQGTVYEVMPKAGTKKWSETVLYSFCSQANCADGQQPEAPPFVDNAGNLYGTTNEGGQFSQGGTVFELSPNGGGYTDSTLYSFCAQANCTDGKEPGASVVMDGSGNLLGTAGGSGGNGDGAIFELSPNGAQWQYNVLASFTGKNGLGPLGNLVLDASGNLFGATNRGGLTKKGGTVFEFNGSIQTLYGFCSVQRCPDGNQPYSGVVEDAAGNLYGTTSMGAKHNSGTLYEVSPSR